MARCPVCGGDRLQAVADATDVPVFCNVLWDTQEEALAAPRGDITLAVCTDCGMLTNASFDPELVRYAPGYENSLHYSPVFQRFAEDLARRLIERYDLYYKRVVDIGCGRGDFLRLMCRATANRGIGYDPSYPGGGSGNGNPSFVRGLYEGQEADFVVCRHVLEHLATPAELLEVLPPGAGVYFEMPDGAYMLREAAVWDLIYEHPSYFTAPALRTLFERAGFTVLDIGASYGDQYLYLEAIRDARAPGLAPSPERVVRLATCFRATYHQKVGGWNDRLRELVADGRRIALWGAGSKGVTFLNTVEGGDEVATVVDLNPRKHGRYVPGTGQCVHAPEALRRARTDVLIITNRLYADEIRALQADLGLELELLFA
jgi:hypothetical protein